MASRSMTFVLLHGAWHGAWCWRQVATILTHAGHQVLTPDLPSLGQDRTPLAAVTLASGVDRICDLLHRQSEPVILVGHSLAGMYISQVAEECPEKIRWLTYLAALLPRNGESMMTILNASEQNPDVLACAEFDDVSMRLRLPDALPWLYHDCLPEYQQLAARLLKAQPLQPLETPVTLSARYERVPRAYLNCSQDRVLPPALQERFYTSTPCEQVHVLRSGHAPFFSVALQLAICLTELAFMEPRGMLLTR